MLLAGSTPAAAERHGSSRERPPSVTARPEITGVAAIGDVLLAEPGRWRRAARLYYRWASCGRDGRHCRLLGRAREVPRRDRAVVSLRLTASDIGHRLRFRIVARNTWGATAAWSRETAVVAEGVNLGPGAPGSTGAAGGQSAPATTRGAGAAASTGASGTTTTGPTTGSGTTTTSRGGGGSQSTPPVNTAPPTVSGSAIAGDTLSASTGSWAAAGYTFSYQWRGCLLDGGACTAIPGAGSSSYTVSSSEEGLALEVVVTASNGQEQASVASAKTAAVPVPPSNLDISIAGSAVLGGQLTVYDHWAGSLPSYSFQWQSCNATGDGCSAIAGAQGTTYTVAKADEGHTIEVVATASNAAGTASASSPPTAVVPVPVAASGAPSSTASPAVSGIAAEGDTLSATTGTWAGEPSSYTYQWMDCNSGGGSCQPVAVAGTSPVYVPTSRDVGSTLEVAVTATNSTGPTRASSSPTAVVTAAGSAPDGLTIVGDQLVDDHGAVVLPHGVDRSGTEYACWQFDAISDGPIDAPSVAAMATWNINFVRVQLNEDCWLGINGVPANVSGQNYVSAIQAFVNTLHQYGMYAYISLMSGHPGSTPPDNNEPNAPDEDHSPLYWYQLARAFRNDPNVILAPQSELSSSSVDWRCYVDGCSNEASYSNGPYDGLPSCGSGCWYYQTAGMKQAVAIMRAAGYNGPISIPCVNWANECAAYDGEGTLGGSWQSEVPGIDPEDQLMAEIHSYTDLSVCASPACYAATLSPIQSAGYPVIFGEIGEDNDCAADPGGAAGLLPWAQANGVGWLSYVWDAWGNCTLISSYEPATPYPGGYGAYVQSLDQDQPG